MAPGTCWTTQSLWNSSRRIGEQFHKDCVVQGVKHPVSVMVWGAISVHGVSLLHIVEGTMRQDQYQQVLTTRLLPQILEWFRDAADAVIFQQNSAPCHVAKKVKEFIQQQGQSDRLDEQ